MLKNIVISGIVSTVVGVHLIENKKIKKTIRNYCPAITKCCDKVCNKDKKSKK